MPVVFTIGLVVLAGAAYVLFDLTVARPVTATLAPATPDNSRVDLLASGPDAIILQPFVTGDVPRLVQGQTLQRLGPDLWFTDTTDVGTLVGAVMLGMVGMPLVQDIAVAFRGGVATATHDCLSVGCLNWRSQPGDMWGMGALHGMGDALGPAVERVTQTFDDHAAYLSAHAAAAADPLLWFAEVGRQGPRPPDSGFREIVVALPTRFLPPRPPGEPWQPDPGLEQDLTAAAADILAGTGGRLSGLSGTVPLSLPVTRDGVPVASDDGVPVALPDLAQVNAVLHLDVPVADAPRVRDRALSQPWPQPDMQAVDAAVAAAFRRAGADGACLPACGAVVLPGELRRSVTANIAPAPVWTLDVWRVPPVLIP